MILEAAMVGDAAAVGAGVGIEEQLGGIETVAGFEGVGALGAKAIELSGCHASQGGLPDARGFPSHGDAVGLSPVGSVEEAEPQGRRMLGEDAESGAPAVSGDSQGRFDVTVGKELRIHGP